MNSFIGLLKRNILVYMKDKQAVFFSVLSPIIVLVLYLLFLRGTFVDGLKSAMNGAASIVGDDDINSFANLILVAGVIGSGLMTVSFASLSTIVADKQNRIVYDILSTPISRVKIILSYIIAACINTLIVMGAILTISLLIISLMGETYLTFISVLELYGILVLGVISAVSLMMIIVMFFKTEAQAGAFTGILCAASGFIIGAYIPISQFSSLVQTICNVFPASHITSLLRDTLLSGVLDHMDTTLNGLDNHVLKTTISEVFSLKLNMFGNTLSTSISLIYVSVLVVCSMVVTGIIYSKTYKVK